MGQTSITYMKSEIEKNLASYLREEGLELYIAANDNAPYESNTPVIKLESIENMTLTGNDLLSEIRVILRVQGKPWQCEALVNGIYHALQPHYITLHDLTVLLMSLHVESVHCVRPRKVQKRAIMRYIVEEHSEI